MNLAKWKPKRPEHPDFEQAIRLQEAVLCSDCAVIYSMRRTSCPACASCAAYSVARMLAKVAA